MDVPTPKIRIAKSRKYLWYFFCGALLVGFLFFLPNLIGGVAPSVHAKDLWIGKAEKGDFVRQVRGIGTLVSISDRWVTVEAGGLVERVLVKPGESVEPNTLLVELSNPLLAGELSKVKSDLSVAEAKAIALAAKLSEESLQQEFDLVQARLNDDMAKSVLVAMGKIVEANVISRLDYMKAVQSSKTTETLLKMLEKRTPYFERSRAAQLASEKANIDHLKYELRIAQEQVDMLNIRAGISGVLQQLTLEEGERAVAGAKVARVAKPNKLMAQIEVQEVQANDISNGMTVEIDTRNEKVQGRVIRVDPRVNDGRVQIDVAIVDDLPQGARPDQSVTGTILIERISNALFIDRPSSVSAGAKVPLFVLSTVGNEARQREVQFGKVSINHIEVLSGLVAGDKVIISDVNDIKQYPAIKIK
jgi:HlyD family secretion protein